MDTIEIWDFSYYMDMNCGCKNDYWRYHGRTHKHSGLVSPSRPISFDEEKLIIQTYSGSLYEIIGFKGNKDAIIKQIKLDIANEGFERY